jgi:REP element-mobilizing transposase RayT
VSSLYKKRFSNKSLRLQKWDYGWKAKYFITINTKNRVRYFGKIQSKHMYLSVLGELAQTYWEMIPEKFSYTKLDEFVVMPDHVHGIVDINNPMNNNPTIIDNSKLGGGFAGQKNPMFHDNLSRILRWYKGRLSFEAHKAGYKFEWQSLFYDHIIRNEMEYYRISKYILDNPENWKK